jgi:hypothetical protein
MEPLRLVCLAQGLYFLFTGLWPMVHMRSFLIVSGPKTDLWLVRTVALLIVVIAVTLLDSTVRGAIDKDTFLLAVGSSVALGLIDIVYVAKAVISPVYLADAVVEALLIGAWIGCGFF